MHETVRDRGYLETWIEGRCGGIFRACADDVIVWN
jgi:hypothetical protein